MINAQKRTGATMVFSNPPYIRAYASAAGKMESRGPLSGTYDIRLEDNKAGKNSWEKAESEMQKMAFDKAVAKSGESVETLDFIYAGDLLNQCTSSTFGLMDSARPFFGVYGACSTMAEGLILAAMSVDGGYAARAAAVTSSHFCTAERQYRMPLEYGGLRTPTAQWTVTGAGCVILGNEQIQGGSAPRITRALCGRIVDMGVNDPNNMGAAMAPAAHDSLSRFFDDNAAQPSDYDLIVTGDLGTLGRDIVKDLFMQDGVDMKDVYNDCGAMIFATNEPDIKCGGSGCGSSAIVLCGHILGGLLSGAFKKVLFAGTGALMSQLTSLQGENIPAICHVVEICV